MLAGGADDRTEGEPVSRRPAYGAGIRVKLHDAADRRPFAADVEEQPSVLQPVRVNSGVDEEIDRRIRERRDDPFRNHGLFPVDHEVCRRDVFASEQRQRLHPSFAQEPRAGADETDISHAFEDDPEAAERDHIGIGEGKRSLLPAGQEIRAGTDSVF